MENYPTGIVPVIDLTYESVLERQLLRPDTSLYFPMFRRQLERAHNFRQSRSLRRQSRRLRRCCIRPRNFEPLPSETVDLTCDDDDDDDFEAPIVSCSEKDVSQYIDEKTNLLRFKTPVELSMSIKEEECMICMEPTTYRFLCSFGHPFCARCMKSAKRKLENLKECDPELHKESIEGLERVLNKCSMCREYALTVPPKEKIPEYLLKFSIVKSQE